MYASSVPRASRRLNVKNFTGVSAVRWRGWPRPHIFLGGSFQFFGYWRLHYWLLPALLIAKEPRKLYIETISLAALAQPVVKKRLRFINPLVVNEADSFASFARVSIRRSALV
jgi:hypothetical protein